VGTSDEITAAGEFEVATKYTSRLGAKDTEALDLWTGSILGNAVRFRIE